MSRLGSAARAYARRGLRVFPLKESGKEPLTEHGCKDATINPDTIAAWWQRWPAANIGIATGEESGVWALDVDGDPGEQSLGAIAVKLGDIPVTPEQITGKGRHLLFAWTEHVGCSSRKLGPGLDVRGNGGYIVAAPSVHPSGKEYRWNPASPKQFAAMPAAFFELLKKPRPQHPVTNALPRERVPDAYLQKAIDGEYQTVAGAPEGQRNHALNTAAFNLGQLHASGLTQQQARSSLVAAAQANGQLAEDGWQAIEAVIASGWAAGLANPRDIPQRQLMPPRGFKPRLASVDGNAAIAEEPRPELQFQVTKDGKLKPGSILNAQLLLLNEPSLAGLFAHDDFAGRIVVTRRPPWTLNGHAGGALTDADVTGCAMWLEGLGQTLGLQTTHSAIVYAASENNFHPAREALAALSWDGEERLSYWLQDYMGAQETALTQAVAAKWLIGAVARIMQPGAKVDTMLILEGAQGLRKSTALESIATLGGSPYFADKLPALGSKDAAMEMQGCIIVEIAELDALRKAEVSQVKAFLSQRTDRFRPPYGRNVVERPRQCVFAGTVNPGASGYLNDPTGGRRFWPVEVTRVDLEALRAVVPQLWAEALHRYRAGESWWLDDDAIVEEAREAQRDRFEIDAWAAKIDPFIATKAKVRTADVLAALDIPVAQQDVIKQRRVANYLKFRGWERRKWRDPDRYAQPTWYFFSPHVDGNLEQ